VQELCEKELQQKHSHQVMRSRDGKTYLEWLREHADRSAQSDRPTETKEDKAAAADEAGASDAPPAQIC